MQDTEVCLQIVTNVVFYKSPGAHKSRRPFCSVPAGSWVEKPEYYAQIVKGLVAHKWQLRQHDDDLSILSLGRLFTVPYFFVRLFGYSASYRQWRPSWFSNVPRGRPLGIKLLFWHSRKTAAPTQGARSRWSYGKIEDYEQSKALDIHDFGKISRKITHVITLHLSVKKVPRQSLS